LGGCAHREEAPILFPTYDLRKVFVIGDLGDGVGNNVETFRQSFVASLKACGIEADSYFIYKTSSLSLDDSEIVNEKRAISQKIDNFNPNTLIKISQTGRTIGTGTFSAGETLSAGFDVLVIDRPSMKEIRKYHLLTNGGFSRDLTRYLSYGILNRLYRDQLSKNCKPEVKEE
jgi:hypothetical protein